jgi:hypothetical protein
MKNLLLVLLLPISNCLVAQLTYVDNFDGVYPYPIGSASGAYNIDLNNDQQNDIKLRLFYSAQSTSCGGVSGSGAVTAWFEGIQNTIGQNKVNGPSQYDILGVDCTNDTLNAFDLWNNNNYIYKGLSFQYFCYTMGIGTHKQGFRLILTNPANGALGYKYGYIDYTITSSGDIVIHGWYYENTFNVPIVANSLLDYPYDGNCIYYDTITTNVTVYDTITTNVTIYDTITTNITTYDTLLVSVTDTLFINTSLGLPAPNNTNAIMVYPNPANDHITIDNGNFALMSNYTLKIENSLGQQVFSSLVNQQQFYVDLNGWSGNGVYFLKLINPQNNIVTIRKIVLQ